MPRVSSSRLLSLGLAALLCVALLADRRLAFADEPAAAAKSSEVSFFSDVRPILQTHCYGCHQPAKRGGEYLMTDYQALFAGGESGDAAIVPGKPQESGLISQITPDGEGRAAMPQGKKPLSAMDRDLIARWIAAGATDDTPASARVQYDMEHPPVYPLPPIITSLHFSKDGQYLAVSGYHEVLLHKADGSELVGRLVGLSERIEKARFSPDSKLLAVAGGSPGRLGEVQVWNVDSRKLRVSVAVTYDTVYGANWSPDQSMVSFGCGDNTVRAINPVNGQQVLFNGAHEDWVRDTVFSVKGDHLISVSRDRTMKLIEVPTQRFIDNITSITPGALKGGLAAIDRHPTKDELLCGGADGAPKIYQMIRTQARKIGDDFNLIRAFPALPGRIFDVQFSPDGSRIVCGSSHSAGGEVRVYNAADAKLIATMDGIATPIYAVAFNHDGTRVASGGFDGQVRIHDAATGKLVHQFTPVPLEVASGE